MRIVKDDLIFITDDICEWIRVYKKQKGRGHRPELIYEYSWRRGKVYDE